MICAWKELLGILPLWLRDQVDRQGREDLCELRLRIDAPPELITGRGSIFLERTVKEEDIKFCINTATRYSPWAASGASKGYITAQGGHRIGLCGEVAVKDNEVVSFRNVASVNIRVARDYPGIADRVTGIQDNLLIIGAPGWGKTTLLRDLARRIAQDSTVAVVDERGELYPPGVARGKRMDVLTGCSKVTGMDMVLRSMGPEWIVIDEITAALDAKALIQAVGCGVKLLATAHASSVQDMKSRKIYQLLLANNLFSTIVVLRRDKSYYTERICQ
jgi:stage III sporulation protein AA